MLVCWECNGKKHITTDQANAKKDFWRLRRFLRNRQARSSMNGCFMFLCGCFFFFCGGDFSAVKTTPWSVSVDKRNQSVGLHDDRFFAA